jgi:hypothetical protein
VRRVLALRCLPVRREQNRGPTNPAARLGPVSACHVTTTATGIRSDFTTASTARSIDPCRRHGARGLLRHAGHGTFRHPVLSARESWSRGRWLLVYCTVVEWERAGGSIIAEITILVQDTGGR